MIVVTGATGHIGNVLTKELVSKGENVRIAIPKTEGIESLKDVIDRVERVDCDVRNYDSVRKAVIGADIVYHLAGIVSTTGGNDKLIHDVNVNGTKNVARACLEEHVKRLVYTSSVHAFIEPEGAICLDETAEINPNKAKDPYAKSKAEATLAVREAVKSGLDAVVVFPSGVIGPYDYKRSELGQLMIDYAQKKFRVYLDGAYDFVDVRDVIAGEISAAEKGRRGEEYLLSGVKVTVKELFDLLERATGVKAPTFKVPHFLANMISDVAPIYYKIRHTKPQFTRYSIAVLNSNCFMSHRKADEELGFKTREAYESIRDSINWFKENGEI